MAAKFDYSGKTVRVSGIVDSLSFVPRPGSVPYKDHIFTIHLTNLQGIGTPVEGTQAVVFMWDMRDSKLTPAAKHREGDKLVLNLHAWADVSGKYGGINQSLPDNDDLMSQEPNWGEEGEL